ncbi:protein-L-isoaspartate(D-aspartate) O-methyltransferase [candidate division WWE3 bacterium]|uniref:Protein-L-isoaspartate O-methyltransferase n=1 Tax=candidate division WWE3 bacterium TaxID=2053526 RepID=A0A955RPU2_UNCKA|nr:protein-L-isoaspartate(D-aspartate) O-methyltransferase [candidate division WWE3 bacterium]
MDYMQERQHLVQTLREEGITNERILNAFATVPRHEFVPEDQKALSYQNSPLPIGYEQTISQPYTIAFMMDLLDPQPGDTVFEIGTGSGYQAALLSKLVKHVYTIERIPELSKQARTDIERLFLENVTVMEGDGTCGYQDQAPFDGIIVTAGAPQVPTQLTNQLTNGRRLVIPEGSCWNHELLKITREGAQLNQESYPGFMFVPLIGECGWEAEK